MCVCLCVCECVCECVCVNVCVCVRERGRGREGEGEGEGEMRSINTFTVTQEIISTERTYVELLLKMEKIFLFPLREKEKFGIPKSDVCFFVYLHISFS